MAHRFATLLLLLAGLVLSLAAQSSPAGGRFLVLSDIHAYAAEDGGPAAGAAAACPGAAVECPSCNPRDDDTKAALFESLLADIACRQGAGFDFAVVTGDWLAHHYQNPGQTDLKRRVLQTLTSRLRAQLGPDTLLIPALGNNDAYQGDYNLQPGGDFLRETAALWKPLFPSSAHLGTCLDGQPAGDLFERSFLAGGYYAFSNPSLPNNCTLVLNTTLLTANYINAWRANGTAAAEAQVEWLAARLEEARTARKSVWILAHVPPGADPWASAHNGDAHMLLADRSQPDFSTLLVDTIASAGPLVHVVFAGHTHDDSFALIRNAAGHTLSWVHISPSVTPDHHSGRSAYQIFDYRRERDRAVLENYVTRHLNFQRPNPQWEQAYSWKEAFCHSQCDYEPASLEAVLKALEAPASREEAEYRRFYAERDGAAAPAINEGDWPYYLCAIADLRKGDYSRCIAH